MSLRIAYITSTFPDYAKCKAGDHGAEFVQSLAGLNHDVHVITTALPEIKNTYPRVTMHKVMQSWNFFEAPRLLQTLMQVRPQIIHINHPTALNRGTFLLGFLPEMLKAMGSVKAVTTVHGFAQSSWIGKKKMLPLLLGSDSILVFDEKNLRAVKKQLAKNAHKVEMLEDGFDKAANQVSRIYSRLV